MAVIERRSLVKPASKSWAVSTREAVDPVVSAKFTFLMTLFLVLVVMRHATNVRSANETSISPISSHWLVFAEHFLSSRSVPFFFVVSGYLLYRTGAPSWDSYRTKFEKRLLTIGLPYLFWASISFLTCALVGLLFHRTPSTDTSLQWATYLQNLISPVGFHLWYLRNLLLLVLASPILYYCLKGSRWILSFTVLASTMLVGTEFWADNARDVLCFCTGMLLSRHEKTLSKPIPQHLWLAGMGIGIFALALNALLVVVTGRQNVVIGLFSTATYPLFVWHLFRTDWPILKTKAYQSLSQNSFFVYLAHVPLLYYVSQIFERMVLRLGMSPLHPAAQGMGYLVSILGTLAICLAVASVMRSKLPRCYALLTGGR